MEQSLTYLLKKIDLNFLEPYLLPQPCLKVTSKSILGRHNNKIFLEEHPPDHPRGFIICTHTQHCLETPLLPAYQLNSLDIL